MRQTILVVAALMLVLSAAAFAVSPVHAAGASTCPGVSGTATVVRPYGHHISGIAIGTGVTAFQGTAPYNPLNDCGFTPGQ
jgi:hypothetical protein